MEVKSVKQGKIYCAPTWSITCQQDDVILVAATGGVGVDNL